MTKNVSSINDMFRVKQYSDTKGYVNVGLLTLPPDTIGKSITLWYSVHEIRVPLAIYNKNNTWKRKDLKEMKLTRYQKEMVQNVDKTG